MPYVLGVVAGRARPTSFSRAAAFWEGGSTGREGDTGDNSPLSPSWRPRPVELGHPHLLPRPERPHSHTPWGGDDHLQDQIRGLLGQVRGQGGQWRL